MSNNYESQEVYNAFCDELGMLLQKYSMGSFCNIGEYRPNRQFRAEVILSNHNGIYIPQSNASITILIRDNDNGKKHWDIALQSERL